MAPAKQILYRLGTGTAGTGEFHPFLSGWDGGFQDERVHLGLGSTERSSLQRAIWTFREKTKSTFDLFGSAYHMSHAFCVLRTERCPNLREPRRAASGCPSTRSGASGGGSFARFVGRGAGLDARRSGGDGVRLVSTPIFPCFEVWKGRR